MHPIKDDTKQTETQAHIFQNFSIIVERFIVIPSHMRKPQTVADSTVTAFTSENRGVFIETDKSDDILLLSWIVYP